MPYIQLDDRQFALGPDEMLVGTRDDAHVRLDGADDAIHAIIARAADGTLAIRRGGAEAVRVNGVPLGAEPVPLVHGDKIEVRGRLLVYGEGPAAGSTQYLATARVTDQEKTPVTAHPAASTGGRLVSLVDGREYVVPSAGLVIGRDPSCDVVVASSQVSRRHATIAVQGDGYVVTDTSTNGVRVNGEQVNGSRPMSRGDVLKIGDEEFRFHAEASPPAAPAVPASPAAPETPAEPAAAAADSSGSEAPAAASPEDAKRPPTLATLEVVNEGVLKGRRFEIHVPLAHVGRGAHNDVVIADSSVSETHAKLQRREGGWVLVDMDSTNGTYVGGRRISGEHSLVGAPDIRFGNVKCVFRALAPEAAEAHGTRVIAPVGVPERVRTPTSTPRVVPRPGRVAEEEPAAPAPSGVSPIIWLVLLLVAGGVIFLLMGR
jgi:pSer/pThr/pTyr-binding forkhead associated (FHA) protein